MTNLVLAFAFGAACPAWPAMAGALIVGFFAYGVSLVLFVIGLRHLGTARTGAYFGVAPFFGTLLAVMVLGETVTLQLTVAGALMALGVWLHLTERHEHDHFHQALARAQTLARRAPPAHPFRAHDATPSTAIGTATNRCPIGIRTLRTRTTGTSTTETK